MMPITALKRFLFETRDLNGEKISQTEIASAIGMADGTVSAICAGKINPSIDTAAAMVAYLRQRTGLSLSMDQFWGQQTDNHLTVTPEAQANG